MKSASNPWIVNRLTRPRARVRVFAFHYAGGSASIFRAWPEAMPSSIEVCPVQIPGRENRFSEKAYLHARPLVEAINDGLHSFFDLPFVFFGYSMGAILGFELARLLREREQRGPVHLFAASSRGPSLPDPYSPFAHLSDEDFVRKLSAFGGISTELLENKDLLECHLPLLRADFQLCANYQYGTGPLLDCPISAYGGTADTGISRQDLHAWGAETSGPCVTHQFDGDHFFIHSCPVDLLKRLIYEISRYTMSAGVLQSTLASR